MFGLITRRRYEQDLDAARAETARQRARAADATDRATTAEFNREQALRQFAEADAANRRLHGRNQALGERISALVEADPEHAAALEQRVARLRRVGARLLAAWAAEKRRADRLQARLDDALGLNTAAVLEGRRWQQTRADGGRRVAS